MRMWVYYSTNCNTIQIWSWCSRYLSSVGNRCPAIYVASYVGRKSEVKKCRQKDLKMLRAVLLSICWIIKQLSWAEYRLIRRYSARFRRIIVNYALLYAHTHIFICTYAYSYTHIRIYLYALTRILIRTYTYTCTHIREYLFAYYERFLVNVYLSGTVPRMAQLGHLIALKHMATKANKNNGRFAK